MPIDPVSYNIGDHIPEFGILGLTVALAPVIKDLIVGWWKARSGDTHKSEQRSVQQQISELKSATIDLRAASLDTLSKLRDHIEVEREEHTEIRENIQRNNETLQRMEVALARLDRK